MTGEPTQSAEEDTADDSIHAQYDWTEIAPTLGVIETVADLVETDEADLDPLFDYIDPEALNSLVRPRGADAVSVSFDYATYQVTVQSSGDVIVRSTQ